MKNTAQYRFTAKKIIAKLTDRLEKEEAPLYADWIISLMREGFKKQDAVDAFRKNSFILLPDGSITTKARQRSLKRRSRIELISEELTESRESYLLRSAQEDVKSFDSLLAAHELMISQMEAEITHVRGNTHELESRLRRIQNENR